MSGDKYNKNPHGPDQQYKGADKEAYEKAFKEYTTLRKAEQPAAEKGADVKTSNHYLEQDRMNRMTGTEFYNYTEVDKLSSTDFARLDAIRDAGVYNMEHADHNSIMAPQVKKDTSHAKTHKPSMTK